MELIDLGKLALEVRALTVNLRRWQIRQAESLQNWGRSECEELSLRRGSPLECGVLCFVSSSCSSVLTVVDIPCFLGSTYFRKTVLVLWLDSYQNSRTFHQSWCDVFSGSVVCTPYLIFTCARRVM